MSSSQTKNAMIAERLLKKQKHREPISSKNQEQSELNKLSTNDNEIKNKHSALRFEATKKDTFIKRLNDDM